MRIISSTTLLFAFLLSNTIILTISIISIFAIFNGGIKGGSILLLISIIFFFINSRLYKVLYLDKNNYLIEFSILKGKRQFSMDQIDSIESKNGMLYFKLQEGELIPIYDSIFSNLPFMINKKIREDKIKLKVPFIKNTQDG